MARLLSTLLPLTLLALAVPATAAPVSRPVDLRFRLGVYGPFSFDWYHYTPGGFLETASIEIDLQASATISVDSAAGTMRLDPGVIQLSSPVTWFQTATTAFSSARISQLTNLTGTFAVGGGAGLPGEPPCPLSGAGACVPQTGFGGVMPLSGTYFISVVPTLVVIPVALSPFGRSGTTTVASFTYDPAPWTVGTARVTLPPNTTGSAFTVTTQGFVGADAFRLVAPMYVSNLIGTVPYFGYLDVEFTDGLGVPGFVSQTVPEPGAALVLGVCLAAGLVVVRRR
jgi:hypothetical protein